MRTSKSISTISYNSEEFLRQKIEQWKRAGIIEFAMWIKHEPEEDEKKSHYHVFLKPARLVQTVDLENDSMELDPNNLDKPFKMISFRVSKDSDWLLYALHDVDYLMEKGLSRQFVYSFEDLQTTCNDTLNDIISHCNDDRKGRIEFRLVQMVRQGMSWDEIVLSGFIPLRYITGAHIMYKSLRTFNGSD